MCASPGESAPREDVVVPAGGVVRRRSTDTFAIEDAHVKRLVRYVAEHVGERFGVERLERLVSFSRRSLEQRFQRCLRCTPYEHVLRARVRRAEDILAESPKCSLGSVARACGFNDTRRFRLVFRRITGIAPDEYHRRRLGDLD